jgi:hypothetical protein
MNRELWIALIEVGVIPGSSALSAGEGAYVNAVVVASDEGEFENLVAHALNEIGLFVVNIEDAEPFSKRAARYVLDDDILQLADEARSRGVCFGAFHVYPAADC